MIPVIQPSYAIGALGRAPIQLLHGGVLLNGARRHFSVSNKKLLAGVPVLTTSILNNPTKPNTNEKQNIRNYHNDKWNKSSIRWYEHKPYLGQRPYNNQVCGSNKLKVVGSVVAGVFVLSHLPSVFLVMAGGALGVGAYRWINLAHHHRSYNEPSMKPFYGDENFPDPRKLLKEYTEKYNEFKSKQPSTTYNYPAPAMAWEAFHSLFPGMSVRAFQMQQTMAKTRSTIEKTVQTELDSPDSPLNSFIVTALGATTNPIRVDPKSISANCLTMEPNGDVQYNPITNEIYTELRAKYLHESHERHFLIKAHGQRVGSKNLDQTPSDLPNQIHLDQIEVTCLQTWRTITLSIN